MMINYSYNDTTNIAIPNINFISSGIIDGELKTSGLESFYKDSNGKIL